MRKIPVRDATTFAKKLLRAGKQRLASAEFLAEHSLYLDSMYLAGYAIECGLKAVLLAHVPPAERRQTIEEHFRGRSAHDFEHLKELLHQRNASIPKDVSASLVAAADWTTDIRYEAGPGDPTDAKECIRAAERLLEWAGYCVQTR